MICQFYGSAILIVHFVKPARRLRLRLSRRIKKVKAKAKVKVNATCVMNLLRLRSASYGNEAHFAMNR